MGLRPSFWSHLEKHFPAIFKAAVFQEFAAACSAPADPAAAASGTPSRLVQVEDAMTRFSQLCRGPFVLKELLKLMVAPALKSFEQGCKVYVLVLDKPSLVPLDKRATQESRSGFGDGLRAFRKENPASTHPDGWEASPARGVRWMGRLVHGVAAGELFSDRPLRTLLYQALWKHCLSDVKVPKDCVLVLDFESSAGERTPHVLPASAEAFDPVAVGEAEVAMFAWVSHLRGRGVDAATRVVARSIDSDSFIIGLLWFARETHLRRAPADVVLHFTDTRWVSLPRLLAALRQTSWSVGAFCRLWILLGTDYVDPGKVFFNVRIDKIKKCVGALSKEDSTYHPTLAKNLPQSHWARAELPPGAMTHSTPALDLGDRKMLLIDPRMRLCVLETFLPGLQFASSKELTEFVILVYQHVFKLKTASWPQLQEHFKSKSKRQPTRFGITSLMGMFNRNCARWFMLEGYLCKLGPEATQAVLA